MHVVTIKNTDTDSQLWAGVLDCPELESFEILQIYPSALFCLQTQASIDIVILDLF